MSELKVYHCNEWHNEYTEFVMKSEADKVIAEKDAEIERLKKVYHKSEVDKLIAELEESHKREVEQLLMEIVKLKKERRWRKYPEEKPTEEKVFLVLAKYLGEDDLHVDLCPYDITAEDFGEWEEEFCDGRKEVEEFISYDVKYWMPMPKAPEEEKC